MRHLRFESVSKHPDEVRVLNLDFFPLCAKFWRPGEQFSNADIVRPNAPTGFAYTAGADGQSGLNEPAWPTADADTVLDGDVTWTAGAAGANGVTAVTSPTVVVMQPGGITLGSPNIVDGMGTNTEINFSVTGGDAGTTYRIEARLTIGSETIRGSIDVEVRLK